MGCGSSRRHAVDSGLPIHHSIYQQSFTPEFPKLRFISPPKATYICGKRHHLNPPLISSYIVSQLPTIPNDVSFSASIELTQQLLKQIWTPSAETSSEVTEEALDEAAIAQTVSALVQSKPGARGFFATYLTGDQTPTKPHHPGIVSGLQLVPEQTTDLLTKNLAMSTAMMLTHSRQDNSEMMMQSAQVQSRSLDLIEVLKMPSLRQSLTQLRDSAATNGGVFEAFLSRWGYDTEQRQHIKETADEALKRLG